MQIVPAMTDVGGECDRLEGGVEFVTVGQELGIATALSGVSQNVDEILARFRGDL